MVMARARIRLGLQNARGPEDADDIGARAAAEAEHDVGWSSRRCRRRHLESVAQAACPELDLRADRAAVADAGVEPHAYGARSREACRLRVSPEPDAARLQVNDDIVVAIGIDVAHRHRCCGLTRCRSRRRQRRRRDIGPRRSEIPPESRTAGRERQQIRETVAVVVEQLHRRRPCGPVRSGGERKSSAARACCEDRRRGRRREHEVGHAILVEIARRSGRVHSVAWKTCLTGNIVECAIASVGEQRRRAPRRDKKHVDVAAIVIVGRDDRGKRQRPGQSGYGGRITEGAVAVVAAAPGSAMKEKCRDRHRDRCQQKRPSRHRRHAGASGVHRHGAEGTIGLLAKYTIRRTCDDEDIRPSVVVVVAGDGAKAVIHRRVDGPRPREASFVVHQQCQTGGSREQCIEVAVSVRVEQGHASARIILSKHGCGRIDES